MIVGNKCDCLTWSQVFVAWKNTPWKWSACEVLINTWGRANIKWVDIWQKWSEFRIIDECIQEIIKIAEEGGARNPEEIIDPWEPWNPYTEKKKKIIQLLCKIQGKDQKTTEKLVKENINIKVKDVKLIIESLKDINVEILNFK